MLINLNRGRPILLAESPADKKFFDKLIEYHQIGEFDCLVAKHGDTTGNTVFGKTLDAIEASRDFDSCPSILICADNDDGSVFGGIARQMRDAGYTPPESAGQFVAANGKPRIAVMLLPGDSQPGSLETLVYRAASDRHRRMAKCVRTFAQCIRISDRPAQQQSKFLFRCLTAAFVKKEPDISIGGLWDGDRAAGYVSLDHQCFTPLVEFLKQVPR